jgi:hypothetical protein
LPDTDEKVNQYIATFHTHFAALKTVDKLKKKGIGGRMSPVPRFLSSSCGTCVRYEATAPHEECLHEDFEQLVELEGSTGYKVLVINED